MIHPLGLALALTTSSGAPWQDETYGFHDLRYSSEDEGVVTFQSGGPLDLGYPGSLLAQLDFRTPTLTGSGQFEAPDLVALWSIRNSSGNPVGGFEWVGGQGWPVSLSTFDPLTGVGTADVDIPVAMMLDGDTFPPLPRGATSVEVVMGEVGSFGQTSNVPFGVRWQATLQFQTDYPPLHAVVEGRNFSVGDQVLVNLMFNGTTTSARTCTVTSSGLGRLKLDGTLDTQWQLTIPATTRIYSLVLRCTRAGLFRLTATLDDGTSAETQTCEILDSLPWLYDELAGPIPPPAPNNDPPVSVPGKVCVPGRNAGQGGDMEVNCTTWKVELLGPPANPDCGSSIKGRVYDAYCKKKAGQCRFDGEETIQAAKYVYAGTVDRAAGSATLGLKIGNTGEVDTFVLKAGYSGEVSGTIESNLTTRCCKFVPGTGTVPVKVKKCAQ